jgi:hypothetical protein
MGLAANQQFKFTPRGPFYLVMLSYLRGNDNYMMVMVQVVSNHFKPCHVVRLWSQHGQLWAWVKPSWTLRDGGLSRAWHTRTSRQRWSSGQVASGTRHYYHHNGALADPSSCTRNQSLQHITSLFCCLPNSIALLKSQAELLRPSCPPNI